MDQESEKHLIQDTKPRKKSHHVESFSIEDSLIVSVEVDSEKEILKTDRVKGILLMSISTICFVMTISLCKYAYLINENVNGLDYILFRGSILILFAGCDVLCRRVNVFRFPQEVYASVILRFFTGAIGMALYFYAIKFLPMSQGSVILCINPLISAVLAYLFLKEVLACRDILCLLGAFGGCVLVNISRIGEEGVSPSENHYFIGICLCFISLLFRSTTPVTVRQMSKYVHSIFSPFYFSLGMFCHAMFLLIFCRKHLHFEHYDTTTVLLFTGSTIANYGAQSIMSVAYSYEKATVLAPFTYIITCGLLLIDCVFFGYDFSLLYFVGFCIILFCVMTPLLIKINKE
ncbi:unnamed protein product [Moneuplotes crassus]|uniref:EamA domain-containing protein n=1 Tax=Euplotes crassus TaxID=5936 RepID=A0AAD1XKS8_EUPCR|nr:unnamed protein product [Moneuplotes crassus]